MPMGDELMLQALESTADQISRLAEIIDEFLTMAEAGVPMSATTRQTYAAGMAELRAPGAVAEDARSLLGADRPEARPVGDGERLREVALVGYFWRLQGRWLGRSLTCRSLREDL